MLVHVVGIYRLCRWSLVWTSSTIPPRENPVFFFSLLPFSRLLLPHLPPCSSTSSSSYYYYFSSSSTYNPPSPLAPLLFFRFFFFFFRGRRRVATPVSDSPQPAIGAALVLCEAIRMFVCESCPSFYSSSSCSFFHLFCRVVRSFSWPLERLGTASSRNWPRSRGLLRLICGEDAFCGLFVVALSVQGMTINRYLSELITRCQGFCFIRESHISKSLFLHDLRLLYVKIFLTAF